MRNDRALTAQLFLRGWTACLTQVCLPTPSDQPRPDGRITYVRHRTEVSTSNAARTTDSARCDGDVFTVYIGRRLAASGPRSVSATRACMQRKQVWRPCKRHVTLASSDVRVPGALLTFSKAVLQSGVGAANCIQEPLSVVTLYHLRTAFLFSRP